MKGCRVFEIVMICGPKLSRYLPDGQPHHVNPGLWFGWHRFRYEYEVGSSESAIILSPPVPKKVRKHHLLHANAVASGARYGTPELPFSSTMLLRTVSTMRYVSREGEQLLLASMRHGVLRLEQGTRSFRTTVC